MCEIVDKFNRELQELIKSTRSDFEKVGVGDLSASIATVDYTICMPASSYRDIPADNVGTASIPASMDVLGMQPAAFRVWG